MKIFVSESVFLVGTVLMVNLVVAETPSPGESLPPESCNHRVLYIVQPIYPSHVKNPRNGCSVSMQLKILPSGKVGYPQDVPELGYETINDFVLPSAESCPNTLSWSVFRALRKAQFAASEKGYQCIYTYNWVWE